MNLWNNYSEGDKMNAKEMAQEIAFELMGRYDEEESVLYDTINKDCNMAVADFRNDVENEVIAILEGHGYGISY